MENEVTVTPVTPAANAQERPSQDVRTLDSIKASVQAEEARLAGTNADGGTEGASAGSATPNEGAPPQNLAKKGIPSGLTDKDGNLSEEKILKANESLEKAVKDKEARLEELLKRNKELRRKFGDAGVVVKQLEQETSPEELTRKELEALEKDPVRYIKGSIQAEIQALRTELKSMREEAIDVGHAKELDSLVEQGHTWIESEGLQRFEDVFRERPYLLQSKNPYRDAVRFMSDLPSKSATDGSAQTVKPLPILGGGHVAPPPSQEPPASKELRIEELSKKLHTALSHGDRASAMRLTREMDKLERGY